MLLYLLKVKKVTHKELSEMFEVSVKTIQRDVDKLSMMGVPVTCKQGNQGGIYIEESYKLTESFFTNEDLQTITIALSMYDSISSNRNKDQVMKKLALISPELVDLLETDANDYFVVDFTGEKIDMTESVYKKINHCLDEEVLLAVTCGDEQILVAPISYVLRSEGLYLYAYDVDYLLIDISTIKEAQCTEIEFERTFISYKEHTQFIFK
ncbi:YafY family protein [Sporosarcina sp. P17b]|uniref:helix-turn-helix transcriptional regulator n=1 Tax=Sporosarcina sp. P17b TaxID=2048260 RepID=UPI0021012487|nr:HTH domain-containing protein [Sporosarcina sp. P17b]